MNEHVQRLFITKSMSGRNVLKPRCPITSQALVVPASLHRSSGDGVYQDGTYIQHSDVAYTGRYRIALLDMGILLYSLNNTTWAITNPNITNVYTESKPSPKSVTGKVTGLTILGGRHYTWAHRRDTLFQVGVMQGVVRLSPLATAAVSSM